MISTIHRRRFGLTTLGILLALPCLVAAAAPADDSPPKLAGTWTWKWKDGQGETHRHVLEVEGEGDKMVAEERFDDEKAIKVEKIKLDGKKLTIAVERGNRRSLYVGTVASDDTINGNVTVTTEGQPATEFGWTATREAGGKKP